ncbi:MAG: hypothetical protein PHV68_03430 [Candidatus Gastranaerophilales bacterium]|nr:hypothetical protein [Candidatus Gastranaerophilales bacterium]
MATNSINVNIDKISDKELFTQQLKETQNNINLFGENYSASCSSMSSSQTFGTEINGIMNDVKNINYESTDANIFDAQITDIYNDLDSVSTSYNSCKQSGNEFDTTISSIYKDIATLKSIFKYNREHTNSNLTYSSTIGNSGTTGSLNLSSNSTSGSVYNKHSNILTDGISVNLTNTQQADLENFTANFEKNKSKYQAVSKKTGMPAELIAALHWRESGGNFNTYLHNGQPLGQVTTIVPKGKYFTNWEDAAVDALSSKSSVKNSYNLTSNSKDMAAMLSYAEYYNGLGYHNNNRTSAYVYSGTNEYTSGKYVADGKYSKSAVDKQLGVAVMLNSIIS